MNSLKTMNKFRGLGAVEPVSIVGEIISRLCGSISQEMRKQLTNNTLKSLNEIDARKIIAMRWDYLTLDQLLSWATNEDGGQKILHVIKVELLNIIDSKSIMNSIYGIDKYDQNDLKHRELVSKCRIDDIVTTLETLSKVKLIPLSPQLLKESIDNIIINNSKKESKFLKN